MVTIESLTRIGLYSWLLKYSSDLEDPWFYIYLDGVLIAETQQTAYNIAISMDEGSVIEVLDDPDIQPMQIFPGKVRLGWFFVAGTDYYRIDEYIGSAWVARYRMPENNGYLSWRSRFLEDGQTHIFRVVPVGTNGNEGTARQFAVLMCRRPDVPDVDYSYNEGTGKVVIFDNDSPPNNLIFNCVLHYKMNDNAANTTVVDSMGNFNGTLHDIVDSTTAGHSVAGKVGTALSFCPIGETDTFIDVGDNLEDFLKTDFSICYWTKPQDGIPDIIQEVFGEYDGSTACDMRMFHLTDGKIQGLYVAGIDDYVNFISPNPVFSEGQQDWHFIEMKVEQINPTQVKLSLYADNILLGSNTADCVMSEFSMSEFSSFYIGNSCYEGFSHEIQWFKGHLDDFMIFNKRLSAEEENFLWNNGNGREDF